MPGPLRIASDMAKQLQQDLLSVPARRATITCSRPLQCITVCENVYAVVCSPDLKYIFRSFAYFKFSFIFSVMLSRSVRLRNCLIELLTNVVVMMALIVLI